MRARLENVVVTYGLKENSGVSMVSASIVRALLQGGNKSILFMSLDGTLGGEYLGADTSEEPCMDDIKNALESKTIRTNEILDICKSLKNKLYFLPGTKDYLERKAFNPEAIMGLITTLSRLFDLIVIDAGSELDLEMSVAALMVAQHHYLVITQQHQVLRRYEALQGYLNMVKSEQRHIILNKYLDDPEVLTKDQLGKFYEDMKITLPYLDVSKGLMAESPGKTLLKEDSNFDNGITQLVNELRQELGWENITDEEKESKGFLKKGFINKFIRKGGGS